jgi:excinuclease UvrABC helicase subunit UvrB
MRGAAEALDFEAAARLRDEVFDLKARRDAKPRKRDEFAAIRASR